jgi:sterol desaturase/sphingolipid hydroxylase (fatty acid hydroxylase superfamily)/ferredoxin
MLEYIWVAFLESALLYSVFTIPFFLIFWVIWKKKFAPIRIQPNQTSTAYHIWHAIGFSMSSLLIFAITDGFMLQLENQGYTLLYMNIADYGWSWAITSFCLVLFIEDTFFYFSHRLMHHPRLYKYFHSVHHNSTDTHPFVSFAFNPTEALVQNIVYCVLPFVFPIHFGVIIGWQLFGMLSNVIAHGGYEIYPKLWTKIPILKYKSTSTHHNMHHEFFNGNYCLHFTWWDKIFGTEFPETEKRHAALFERTTKAERGISQIQNPNTPQEASISTISVTLGTNVYQFEGKRNINILESALQQNIPLPYQCKSGICGKCKLQCVHGEVSQIDSPALNAEAQQNGYFLACQSLPISENISLKNKNV